MLQVVAQHEAVDGRHLAAAGFGGLFRGAERQFRQQRLDRFVESDGPPAR